jgi:hypothetical protein
MLLKLDFLLGGILIILGIAQLFDCIKSSKRNSDLPLNFKVLIGNFIIVIIGIILIVRNCFLLYYSNIFQ